MPFSILSAMYGSFTCYTSLPVLDIASLFPFHVTHTNRWAVLSHCGVFLFFFFVFCLFRAAPAAHGGSQARVLSNWSCCCWPTPQPPATPDPSQICDLHHSSRQHWILNPLSEARIEPVSSWLLVGFVNYWAMTGTPNTSCFLRLNSIPLCGYTRFCLSICKFMDI